MSGGGAVLQAARVRFKPRAAAVFGAGYTFDHDDIRNVAVSGPYSAGKSSILETYKKKHNEKKYIHISLARFEESPNAPSDTEEKEIILEGKILNQLIQQIDPAKIPQTHFRVKRPHSLIKKGLFAFCSVIFVLLIFYLIYFSGWVNYVNGLADGWMKSVIIFLTANQVNRLLVLILAVVLAALGIYTIINIQLNKGLFKKLSVQGNEIEIFSDDEESFFDKYLNEVLYLFEKAGADVIVFEDIDRYNSVEIFQRLREINTLVNRKRSGTKNSNQILSKLKKRIRKQSKRKQINTIRFFYLLRDDMFVSKDRTKFFDFIIPVVPVIDGSNSYGKIIEIFASDREENRFSSEFLQGVSLYIDDMRILKNICNEYQIYRRRIVNTEQDNNKLLAMVIYKNIFPRDFSELQLNRGFVYKVFRNKDKFIKREEICIDNRIADYKEEIEIINGEILKDKTEIERLYKFSSYHKYESSGYDLKEEYAREKQERIKVIEDRSSGKVSELQSQIEALQAEKAALYDKNLSEIITRENIDDIFSAEVLAPDEEANKTKKEEIEKEYQLVIYNDYFDLLKYLIRNGYIDETYPDYMSYFCEHSLSKADKMFLRSITDQKAKDYQYKLNDPHKVVGRLRNIDFSCEEIRNYDLLAYLLKEYDVKHIYIQNFVHCLRNTEALDFVFGYIDRSQELNAFIKALCMYWSGIFDAVMAAPEYSESQIQRIALLIIYYAGDLLTFVNETGCLSDYINHKADFLSINDPVVKTIIKSFEVLDIHFCDIHFSDANTELINAVYHRCMYELNEVMIGNILEYQYHIERSDEYRHKNLSLIRLQPESALCQYVDSKIEDYIKRYTDFCGEDIRDDEETVAWVVNHEELSDESKESYLDCLSVKVGSLKTINELRWQSILLSMDLAVCSMANVLEYFFANENTIDEALTGFINRNKIEPDISRDFNGCDPSKRSTVFNAIIKCDLIDDRQYRILVDAMNRYYKSFSIANIADSKIRILIDLHIIRMSGRDVLLFMRKSYPGQVIYFIEQNIKEYCDIMNTETIDLKEVADLLNTRIRVNYKLRILSYTEAPFSVRDKGYQGKLILHLLQHNFDENDLPFLLANYEKYCAECRRIILKLLISHIETVIVEAYPLSFQLTKTMIDEQTFEPDRLFVLFSISVGEFVFPQANYCLSRLGETEYLSLFEGKNPKFAYTAANQRILNAFLQKGWISSYVLEPDGKYRAYSKKGLII